jgi:hypothetical protein
MKRFFILFFAVLLISSSQNGFGQTGYYRTYNDFKKDRLDVCEDYIMWMVSMGKTTIKFKQHGNKLSFSAGDIWGFKFKDVLFRFDADGFPVRVVSTGKITYYENGFAHIGILKREKSSYEYSYGHATYFSRDLKSEIFPMAYNHKKDDYKKVAAFIKQFPEYTSLFECIEKVGGYEACRECVQKFEKGE